MNARLPLSCCLAAAVAAALASGCGGSSTLSKSELAKKADAICREGRVSYARELGPNPNFPAAIAVFGNVSDTINLTARAQALRQVAESQNLYKAEFNRAFVLMQYFGYLRRDPNSGPDKDFGGYNFWLGKLNQFGGDYIKSEMVKAFIDSAEYRARFGP